MELLAENFPTAVRCIDPDEGLDGLENIDKGMFDSELVNLEGEQSQVTKKVCVVFYTYRRNTCLIIERKLCLIHVLNALHHELKACLPQFLPLLDINLEERLNEMPLHHLKMSSQLLQRLISTEWC